MHWSDAPTWYVNYFYIKGRRAKFDAGLYRFGFSDFQGAESQLLLENFCSDHAEMSGFVHPPLDGGMGCPMAYEEFLLKSSDINTWTRTSDYITFLASLTDSSYRYL